MFAEKAKPTHLQVHLCNVCVLDQGVQEAVDLHGTGRKDVEQPIGWNKPRELQLINPHLLGAWLHIWSLVDRDLLLHLVLSRCCG
jgi:hypothetical protein